MSTAEQSRTLVLIVDDDISMRMLMRAALENVGYEVVEAENGSRGLELFAERRPAAILLDVVMPELDGFETCSALRKLPGGEYTPVLMVTGLEDIKSIHRAYGAGATDFITKPINWVMLGYRVRYMLRASQAFLDLHQSRTQLAEAQQLAKLGNWELNLETGVLFGSPEFFRISGLAATESQTQLDRFVASIHPANQEDLKLALEDAAHNSGPFSLDYRVVLNSGEERIIHKRGEVFSTRNDEVKMLRGFIQDVTELRRAEEQTRYLAYYDSLTGLANRELFEDRLQTAMAIGSRRKSSIALLFLDLDRFKRINDTLGHQAGDLLLKNVAERINCCVRDTDSVARFGADDSTTVVSRLGGDEFIVLLTDLTQPQDAVVVAQRIIDAVPKPFNLQGHEVHVTISIGISVFPSDGHDAMTLLKNADAAMYEAKSKGRNNFQFYKETLNAATTERLSLENDLHKALERGELLLHYQPQVDIETGRIVGVEALLRWLSPTRGLVAPGDFIPLAEDSGLVIPLTEWVIKTACEQNRAWQLAGLPPIKMAVNISGHQFTRLKIAEMAQGFLASSGLDPKYLEIELTESTLMENKDVVKTVLDEVKKLGATIAIDDFGTGYSSLSYLKSFPIDSLKIDRSFVREISTDPNDAAIVKAIVAMAHSLELKVIAEGVETTEQLRYLQQLGCDEYQGFLFSRPLQAESFAEKLKRNV